LNIIDFFRTTQELEYLFFLSRQAQKFVQQFNITLYDKNSESYFFFSPPKSEYFFQQHWELEYFFRKKTIPPPPSSQMIVPRGQKKIGVFPIA
jgi:hypothetical protein